MSKSFFPQLLLSAGGLFEKAIVDSHAGGRETTFTNTVIQPNIDLNLITPLYQAGVGYNRREKMQKASGSPSSTDVNENYDAVLKWRPVGFPDWALQWSKTNTYDKDRNFRDQTTDRVLMTIHYASRGVDVRYQPTYSDTVDRIGDQEIRRLAHVAKVTYSTMFFRGRTALSGSYAINRTETEIIASGGEVSFPLFPFSGLSAINDHPPSEGALAPNQALIDGNTGTSAGLNLGIPPPGEVSLPRNMGLDFFVQNSEVNTLLVWVDRELPPEIADGFSWEVFSSPDNQNWTRVSTVFPAPFGQFQNYFEIRFSSVTSRYVKVVTLPLSASVPNASQYPEIFVTEIQAIRRRPAEEVRGKTTRTSQNGDVSVRTRLLDRPSLHHEFSLYLFHNDPPSQTSYNFSNALSFSHAISPIFSLQGRLAREDTEEETRRTTAYAYTASLTAVPLRTVRQVLLFSGRNEQLPGGSADRHSLFLYTNAQLYRGINVYLNEGVSRARLETGEEQDSWDYQFGVGFVPHPSLSLTLNANGTTSDRKGGGRPDETTVDRRYEAGVSWRLFPNMYAVASVTQVEREDIQETLQNYAVNWSPFPSGALRFNFLYNQGLSSRDNARTETISPSLRWNVTRRIVLDLSYLHLTTKSSGQTGESDTFNSNLRITY